MFSKDEARGETRRRDQRVEHRPTRTIPRLIPSLRRHVRCQRHRKKPRDCANETGLRAPRNTHALPSDRSRPSHPTRCVASRRVRNAFGAREDRRSDSEGQRFRRPTIQKVSLLGQPNQIACSELNGTSEDFLLPQRIGRLIPVRQVVACGRPANMAERPSSDARSDNGLPPKSPRRSYGTSVVSPRRHCQQHECLILVLSRR